MFKHKRQLHDNPYLSLFKIRAIIVSVNLLLPNDISKIIAKNFRHKRLSFDLTQKTLAERSGVSLGTLKKFELTGKISLESLLKLALVLDSLNDFQNLFSVSKSVGKYKSLDEIIESSDRKRGRT